MKTITIKDVAREALVSPTLVSRVMNAPKKADGTPDCVVNPKTAERIFSAVNKLGYRPNKAAVSLRRGMKKRVGFVIPDISNQFFSDIARHFESIASRNGYVVLFGSSDEDAAKQQSVVQSFVEDGVDGVVVVPCVGTDAFLRKYVDEGVPVVLAIRDIPSIPHVGRIVPNDLVSVNMAMEHFVEQGRSHIEMLSGVNRLSTIVDREAAYKSFLQDKGLPFGVNHYDDRTGLDGMLIILEDMLRRGTDAVLCPNARNAIRCIEAARELRVRIPEDVALIGYDGGRNFLITMPQVTHIEFSREEIAQKSFSLLLSKIQNEESSDSTVLLSPVLRVYESTVPAKDATVVGGKDDRTALEAVLRSLRAAEDSIERMLKA